MSGGWLWGTGWRERDNLVTWIAGALTGGRSPRSPFQAVVVAAAAVRGNRIAGAAVDTFAAVDIFAAAGKREAAGDHSSFAAVAVEGRILQGAPVHVVGGIVACNVRPPAAAAAAAAAVEQNRSVAAVVEVEQRHIQLQKEHRPAFGKIHQRE